MKILLRIDASSRHVGSYSRSLADHYESLWRLNRPSGRIIRRDVAATPPPHLDENTISTLYGSGTDPGASTVSDELIAELEAADDILISSAMYNFNMPSTLKAWLDQVVRPRRTFAYGPDGPRGLLGGRSLCLITARGGFAEAWPDHQGPSLCNTFKYLGLEQINWVSLEGTQVPDGKLDLRLEVARIQIDTIFNS